MDIFNRGCCILCGIAMAATVGAAQNIQSFPAPYSAYGVAAGPDGAMWLTPNITSPSGSVGRMTTSGQFTQFSPPGGYFAGGPIVTGPDGNLWLQIFSENNTAIAQMTTAGVSTVYALGETDGINAMVVGPDGAIWLAEGDRIGRITTAGVYTHFLVGTFYPLGIAVGSDGNLWFPAIGATGNSVIGRITPAGVSTTFPVPGELPIYAVSPIAEGPDGAIWFTIFANGAGSAEIGRITTTGTISTFSIPNSSTYNFGEASIAASPDGGLWFTGNGALARMTTSGAATVYPLSSSLFATYAGAVGEELAAGPDGAMWFGVYGNNAVGRATLSSANPTAITQITPSLIPIGSAATALKILGTGLAGSTSSPCSGPAETVAWNTTPLTITSDASGEIDVTVPANLLATAGSFTVAVSVNQVNGTSCAALTATGTVQVIGAAKTATTTTLRAAPNPASAGQLVTLTATVSASAASGTVAFYDGTTSLGSTTVSAGAASLQLAFAFGSHTLTATYSGDGIYATSTSSAVNLQVNAAVTASSISLTASPTSQTLGGAVVLTATVTPSTATGTVTFLDGTAQVSSAMLSGGAATVSISTLGVGSHTLSASYGGDANDAASNSAPVGVSITNPNQPSILAGGIVNAASYAAANGVGSPVAPGTLVAIFTSPLMAQAASFSTASLPDSLSGVGVTFNGIAAPMVQVVPGGAYPFVSAQVPFEMTPGTASVVINVNNIASAPVQTQIVASQPGIFTLAANGLGQAVFVNIADYTIAAPSGSSPGAHPIPRGQSAYFYVTGLGTLSPSVVDGTGTCPAPNGLCNANAMPTVTIGGVTANVIFAGQAPGYPGVMQINLTVPSSAPTGASVALVVTSADGTVISNSATIAVQ